MRSLPAICPPVQKYEEDNHTVETKIKQIGKVVSDDPFTVGLNFEPSGRASGKVGQYYK